MKRAILNNRAKMDDVIAHLIAVETMIDGMRREIWRNGQKEVLTFKKMPLVEEEDGF